MRICEAILDEVFTGIVQALGRVAESRPDGMTVSTPPGFFLNPLQVGESIAVNGVCLTALKAGEDLIAFDISPETFAKTALGDLQIGHPVNLERAMRADSMFGGHIMQGHVDGTGRVESITTQENAAIYRFQAPEGFDRYLIEKGSVAIDGISLTVVNLRQGLFEVWVIPHTLRHTNLGHKRPGDRVNMEFDVIAKYVEKLIAHR